MTGDPALFAVNKRNDLHANHRQTCWSPDGKQDPVRRDDSARKLAKDYSAWPHRPVLLGAP